MQSAANMMNEEQKVFAFEVLAEIGGNLGNMNNTEFVNTLMGMSAMNKDLDPKEAAAMLVYRFGKDPDKVKDFISGLGFDLDGIKETVGSGEIKTGSIFNGGKKDTGTTLEDGTTIDPGKSMNKDELAELRSAAETLGNKFYNGEITEEEFRKDYAKLENVMNQHGIRKAVSGGILSADDYIKQIRNNRLNEIGAALDELNANAKNMSTKDYEEQYEDLKANAKKWGIDEKSFNGMEKEKNKAIKKTKK